MRVPPRANTTMSSQAQPFRIECFEAFRIRNKLPWIAILAAKAIVVVRLVGDDMGSQQVL